MKRIVIIVGREFTDDLKSKVIEYFGTRNIDINDGAAFNIKVPFTADDKVFLDTILGTDYLYIEVSDTNFNEFFQSNCILIEKMNIPESIK
jgi:hypothetical protein